jgi:Na+-translocating ferredoxin:NAD+ oxidoreductase RnfC subunit
MRQLIGKTPIKRGAVEEIYLSECVRCQICQATVPMGIEVVTVLKEEKSKKIIRQDRYCRAHGADYTTRTLG